MLNLLSQFWRRMLHYLRREKLDRELEEEMRFHLEMKVQEKIDQGIKPTAARDEARRQFGNRTRLREMSREIWSFKSVETLIYDIRFGWRMLLKQFGITLIALISLTFGIGANTAIFSLFNTAMLRPLPVERPSELVALNNAARRQMFPTFSYPNYKDFRDRGEAFSGLIGYSFAPLNLSYNGINERLWGYLVTGNYFEVLGVKAAIGRAISTEDDRLVGASPVAVISYKYWQNRFGGEQDVIGKNVIVNGSSYTIIGVAPQNFFGTEIISAPDMWFPLAMQPQIDAGRNLLDERDVENIFVMGRLRSGISRGQTQTELNLIASQLEREYPEINGGKRVTITPPGLIGGAFRGPLLGFTGLLMLVVGLVLLLACINLANLLLARGAERRREIAVRLALGASRFRLIRQLLTESLLLSSCGGAVGILFAFWLVKLAVSFKPPVNVPLTFDLHIDYRVLIFNCAISILAGILFGLIPALQATKTDLVPALKDENSFSGYRRSWLKNSLIVTQVALSLVLLIGGGLMLRGLQRAESIDLGFNPQNAIEASFDLRLQGYGEAHGKEMQKRFLERMRTLPGVQAAGIANIVPVDLHFSRDSIFIEGQPSQRTANVPRAMSNLVSPGYFRAMNTRLVRGRDFTEQDDEKVAPVAIINETFARNFWPGEDPIGKRFSIGSPDLPKLQVIGVVQDGKYAGLNEDPKPAVSRPLSQFYSGATSLIVRTTSDPQKLIPAIRGEIQQLDPHLAIALKTMNEKMSLPLLPTRVAASVLGGFGVLALLLAAIGIYGVMSYAVSRRTREIGIRMALGAQKADVLRLIIGQGTSLLLIGIVIGLIAALALTSLMQSMLFGISSTDPLTFVSITSLLLVVSLLALYLPARRAIKVDPTVALRYE